VTSPALHLACRHAAGAQSGPLPPRPPQIAGALHYIHGRNILHRDLKTQNILLNGTGVPILADFGISKVRG
jgi:hypothetical protein